MVRYKQSGPRRGVAGAGAGEGAGSEPRVVGRPRTRSGDGTSGRGPSANPVRRKRRMRPGTVNDDSNYIPENVPFVGNVR